MIENFTSIAYMVDAIFPPVILQVIFEKEKQSHLSTHLHYMFKIQIEDKTIQTSYQYIEMSWMCEFHERYFIFEPNFIVSNYDSLEQEIAMVYWQYFGCPTPLQKPQDLLTLSTMIIRTTIRNHRNFKTQ